MSEGVWKTVGGRRILIKDGQSLTDAMKESGKFGKGGSEPKDKSNKIDDLKKKLGEAKGLIAKSKIKEEISAIEEGFDNVEDYRKSKQEKKDQAIKENEEKQKEKQSAKQKEIEDRRNQLKKDIEESPKEKVDQYEIIKESNPMLDDYHVGIRSPKDIKTFAETLNDDDSFAWGDFSKKDAQSALKKGEITVYSSKPIENGAFVSSSKIQAVEYAGGKGSKVFSKVVPLEDVAWINGDEGQFAKIKK